MVVDLLLDRDRLLISTTINCHWRSTKAPILASQSKGQLNPYVSRQGRFQKNWSHLLLPNHQEDPPATHSDGEELEERKEPPHLSVIEEEL